MRLGQGFLEKGGVTERGGHEEEAGLGECQQWDLPRDAAVAVGVVMEFVHDDFAYVGGRALAQGDVGEDFGGAAEDGGVAIDGGVAGAEADVFGAEFAAEGEPFFVDKGLDGAGVDGSLALGDGLEERRRRDKGLAGPGGGVEDDVFFLEQFKDGGFLGGIKLEAAAFGVFEKAAEEGVVAARAVAGDQVVKGGGHDGFKY